MKSKTSFRLPPDVWFEKQRLSNAWAYVFRHRLLGVGSRLGSQFAAAILPPGEESLKLVWKIAEQEFNDFAWAQFVFSDLEDRLGLRGFICVSKVLVAWPDQITVAAGGEAVL